MYDIKHYRLQYGVWNFYDVGRVKWEDAIQLHYGKCRIQFFLSLIRNKSRDILASAAQILNMIFLKHLFSFILIVERRHEIIGDMEQGETPQLALNQWLWTYSSVSEWDTDSKFS